MNIKRKAKLMEQRKTRNIKGERKRDDEESKKQQTTKQNPAILFSDVNMVPL